MIFNKNNFYEYNIEMVITGGLYVPLEPLTELGTSLFGSNITASASLIGGGKRRRRKRTNKKKRTKRKKNTKKRVKKNKSLLVKKERKTLASLRNRLSKL